MPTTSQQLSRQIMRRVWYSFGVSIITSLAFVQGLACGVSILLLTELVFVQRVVEGFLATPMGEVPQWVGHVLGGAVESGEFLTLTALGIICMTLLSLGTRLLRMQLSMPRHPSVVHG